MFIGEHKHSLDIKGRVIIPAKFRELLGDRFVITKGLDNCLFAYPLEEWQSLAKKLNSLPLTDKDVRMFIRFFFAGAFECEIDKQGRALIPQNLREYAKLEKDIVVTGALSRIEIWSNEEWLIQSLNIDTEQQFFIEKMIELGI